MPLTAAAPFAKCERFLCCAARKTGTVHEEFEGSGPPHLLMVSNRNVHGLAVVGRETWIEIKTSIGRDCDRVHVFLGLFVIRHYDL